MSPASLTHWQAITISFETDIAASARTAIRALLAQLRTALAQYKALT